MARITLKVLNSDIAEFREKYKNVNLKIPEELNAYISDAEQILEKYPESEGKARKILGEFCASLGCELVVFGDDLEHGIPYYHKAIELCPDSYEIRWGYYTTLEELIEDEDIATPKLIQDAIDCLQFCIDFCNTPELKMVKNVHLRYAELARVYLVAGQHEKAAECARKSLEIEENNGARAILEENREPTLTAIKFKEEEQFMAQYITRTDLKKCLNAMAVLDIVMQAKEQAWLRLVNVSSIGKANAIVIDNGSGDELVVIFTENGTLIKGFDHESEYNQFAADEWDNEFFEYTFSGLPEEFAELLDEDSRDNTTFCMWCMDDSDMWVQNEQEINDDDDGEEDNDDDYEDEDDDDEEDNDDDYEDEDDDGGKEFLLSYIRTTPEEWCDWAKDYYETEIASDVVKKVYNGEKLTEEDVIKLNPERNAKEVFAELEELSL